MRKFALTLAAAAAVVSAGLFTASRADAMTFGGAEGVRIAADELNMIEQTQVYIYSGQRYCWYPDGWRGPGWYRCGYRLRHGFGWGGGVSWYGARGWRRPGVVVVVPGRRVGLPGAGLPGRRVGRPGPGPGRAPGRGPGRGR